MRILMVNKFHYRRGGAEHVHFMTERLLTGAGHEIAHLSMHHHRNQESIWEGYFLDEVSYDAAPWDLRSWKAARRLFGGADVAAAVNKIVVDTSPDVAILGNVYHQLGQSTLMDELARLGIPMVHMLHDYKIVCPSYHLLRDGKPCELCADQRFYHAARHACGGSRARGLLLALEAYHQAHRWGHVNSFVAPSQFLIEQAGKMGFPHPIRLIRNPVALDAQPSRAEKRLTVGYAGRLSIEKGLELLIECARALPRINFRIAGRGPLEDELRRDLPGNVAMLGFLTSEELLREMGTWRLAVVPSLTFENAPGAVLEAYGLAIPVVGANHGGLAELLASGGVGVTPGDSRALADGIAALWDDPGRCRTLGEIGLEFVQRECSPERFLAGFQDLLREVVG